MIKVLHFVSTPAIWSGVMSVIMNYYRHMDRSRIQFDFLCFIPCKNQQESYEREIEELGGRVFFVVKPGSSPGSVRELSLFFKNHGQGYQWLHNHEVYLSFLLKPIAVHFGISNFIVHSHTTKFSDRRLAALRNGILCIPIRFMHCRKFACSLEAGTFLFGKRAVELDAVYVLHNAIEAEKYAYKPEIRQVIRRELGVENCFVVGHVGRFVPQKNHEFLISTFKELLKAEPVARLLLIGDGPLRESVKKKCLEEKIDGQVVMLGQRNDVAELFNAMDVFVLPSVFEGVGIALVEAQANGLFGLASDCVPKEAEVTGRVQFLPLREEMWIDTLRAYGKESEPRRRPDVVDSFREKHYEIMAEASKLQEYYENTNTHVHV